MAPTVVPAAAAGPPTVRVEYRCSCGRVEAPLLALYACKHCLELRCRRCVREEVVCYYCPACLNEAPSASFKAGRGRCTRECFRCPLCAARLNVVASADETRYSLACGVCRWTPLASAPLESDRVSGLAALLQKREVSDAGQQRFELLQRELANFALALSLPTSSTTITTAAGKGDAGRLARTPAWTVPPPIPELADADAESAAAAAAGDELVRAPTLSQRLAVPGVDVAAVRYIGLFRSRWRVGRIADMSWLQQR